MYVQRFGTPADPPRGSLGMGQRRASVQEIYDELKISDDMLSGAYANGLMIAHSATEFKLDFLTNMYPHSAVSCRVFVAAPQLPRITESLHTTWVQYQQRLSQQRRPGGEGGGSPPSAGGPESGPTDTQGPEGGADAENGDSGAGPS